MISLFVNFGKTERAGLIKISKANMAVEIVYGASQVVTGIAAARRRDPSLPLNERSVNRKSPCNFVPWRSASTGQTVPPSCV